MSTTQGYRARRTELRRQEPFKTYDHYRLYPSTRKTVGDMKAERLAIKNARRAEHGLSPKATYAEI